MILGRNIRGSYKRLAEVRKDFSEKIAERGGVNANHSRLASNGHF